MSVCACECVCVCVPGASRRRHALQYANPQRAPPVPRTPFSCACAACRACADKTSVKRTYYRGKKRPTVCGLLRGCRRQKGAFRHLSEILKSQRFSVLTTSGSIETRKAVSKSPTIGAKETYYMKSQRCSVLTAYRQYRDFKKVL